MSDTSSIPRLWRTAGPTPPGAARRARLLAVLLALTAFAGIGAVLLYWLSPQREVAVLPVAITTAPWGEQDRAAIVSTNLLGHPLEDASANPSRDQIRLRFAALAKASRAQPVVIHLAAPASVDAAGGVFLLPADANGDSARNRLTLAELLAAVRDCPARHKLLILNLTPPVENALFSLSPGDLSAAVFAALDAVPDDNRLSLVACGPGQTPFASPELGRSVFSFYLEAGLKGAADNRDNRVSVKELANFVRTHVNRWSLENRGKAQTPVLVGSAPDFDLRAYPNSTDAEEKLLGEIAYPDWLKAAWESLERARSDGRATTAPWAYRQARNALVAAERDLRAGHSADEVKRVLDQRLANAEQIAVSLRAVPTPDPLPTLAGIFPGYVLPEPALVEQLRATAIAVEAKPPVPTKPDEKPIDPPLPPEFDAFKTKPHALLAAAAFLVLAEDADVSASRVKTFAKLLSAQDPQVRFAEVLLIRRLAALADQGALAPWSGERAALALQTARLLEDAATRLDVIACAKPALDEAYQLRADAEAVLFAPGFASPEEATTRLRAAESNSRKVKVAADRLQAAIAARDEAALWLTGATALVNSGTLNATETTAVAEAVVKLNAALPQPDVWFTTSKFADRVPEWDRLASNLRIALTAANRPLTSEALAALRKQAANSDAGITAYAELDAVLTSPLVPVADRVLLWNARSALARRLCENTLRKDATDDEVFRNGSPRPVAAEPASEEPYDIMLAERRARWTVSLLRVGEVDTATVQQTEKDLTRLARERFAFADRLRRVWVEEAPTPVSRKEATPSLAAVLPPSPATAPLDSPAINPLALRRREVAHWLWAWQAVRFEYEKHESVDGAAFLTTAAKSCAAAANTSTFSYVEIAPTATPKLTFEKPSTELKLNLRAIGAIPAGEKIPVNVRALTPSDEWLKPVPTANATLDPIRESAVALSLTAGSKPTSHPSALGVLVEADVVFNNERRTFHRRVPVSLRTLANRVDLLVRTDPKAAPQPLSEFRVRPNGVPVSYQFVLFNPSPLPQRVIARLAGSNHETPPLTLEPDKPVPLVFASTAPQAPVPAPTSSAKPDDGFRALSDNVMSLELLDAADKESVLQTFTLPVAVADPASYLRVSGAAFTPASDGKLNQLSMTVVPGDIPTSAACPVKMIFPPQFNRGLLVRDGSQASSVVNAGKSVKLYTENLAFPSPTGANVVVTLSADGVERVFTYAAALPTLGETVQLQPVANPRVRIAALDNTRVRMATIDYARGDVPLPVTLEVDNAPTGAKLELLIGTAKDNASSVAADLTLPISTARARVVKLRFDAKGETFELVGSLTDHKPVLPVELLTGKRALEAHLLAPDGEVIAKDRVFVVFDGNTPADVKFLELPPKAAKNQPLAVKATCGPTVSGIKEVKFFVGKPNKDELPTSPMPVPGVQLDDANEWRATLQMPDTKGIVVVGVKFTTNAGLSVIETQEIELADAAELNKPAPGAIAGKLTENRIVQPAATVFLYDAKGNPLAKATTKVDGTFEFKELPPGNYYLFSEKISTNRLVKESVVVKPGETTAKELELLLK